MSSGSSCKRQGANPCRLTLVEFADTAARHTHTELRSQMQRAAMSIPANIAEGRGKRSDKEQARFLRISTGSAYGLEARLIMARDLEYIEKVHANRLIDQLEEVRKILFGLIKYLEGDDKA